MTISWPSVILGIYILFLLLCKKNIVIINFLEQLRLAKKGQVVIPSEARVIMELNKGDKLMAFSAGEGMIVLSKIDNFEKIANHLSDQLSVVKKSYW